MGVALPEPAAANVAPQPPWKVLLIEHDEAFARAVSGMLELARDTVGAVVTVRSLEDAAVQLARDGFGVILLEFFLPDGAGLLNIPLLKELAPHVPVIVVGAVDDETLAVEAVHAGAQDYLVKGQLNARWLLRSIRYARERHAADQALLAAEEKYRGIFDHLVEGIFQTTPDGHYLMANTALARIYGYDSPAELMASITDIGRRLYVQPGRREEFKRIMEEHDTITGFESQIYRKDGSIIWISENCRAIRDARGRLLYYEGTVEDITQRRQAEDNLRQSESLYHSLVESIPQNIFRKDRAGRFIFANQRFCGLMGRKLDEIVGKTDFDFFPKSLAAKYRADDERVMATGELFETVEEHQGPDGETMIVQVVKTPLHDAAGQVIGVQGMFWDITRERRTEEKLRASETLYHSLVETLPQNIFRKDLESRFTFANRNFCRTVGRTLEEVVGRTDFDLFPADLAEKYRRDDQGVMTTGRPLETVEEYRPAGGEKIYIKTIKTPLRGPYGQIIGLQGIFWDITKERQMEEDLRNSEALYHSLVETMPQCIFRKDLEGRYTFVNPQFCKMLGHPAEAILGRTIFDFLPRELAEQRRQDDQIVLQEGRLFEQIERSAFHGAENQFIHVLKIPIFDANGKVVGLQGMFWDITAQKLAEERIRAANAELARSREELRQKNALLEENLKMAREIQLAMLPQQFPAFPPGARPAESAFQFTHRYHPTGTVGGDFFSVTALSDTEVAVFICDVAGHGVRSALVTAMIRALVEELRPLAHEPGRFMTKLNSELFAILKHTGTPVLTTAFYLVAHAATGQARYANAGHPKPLHIRRDAGEVETLKNATRASQPALGLFENATYQTSETTLAPRDLVMLFTDGLYEIHAANQELYTQELLAAAVRERLQLPAAQLFDEVLAEIREFAADHEFADDVCVVGVDYRSPAPTK
jgi:sigma-B regulation protein RsbU (phosphoserine phosphatase)